LVLKGGHASGQCDHLLLKRFERFGLVSEVVGGLIGPFRKPTDAARHPRDLTPEAQHEITQLLEVCAVGDLSLVERLVDDIFYRSTKHRQHAIREGSGDEVACTALLNF
jgi:hypothetical protein